MRAVVTGGAGFIGSNVVDAIASRGADILVIDDFSTGQESNLESARKEAASLEVERTDISAPATAEAIKKFKPDTVFHLAAQINVRRSVSEPVYDADKNVCGTVNVLEACREAGTKKLIFASTGGAIYGEQDVFPAPEDHAVRAESPYGIGKRAAELYLEYYSRVHSMNCVSLRFANVYGPRQNPKGEAGVVAIFSERLLAGDNIKINGDGEQTRDFVFVRDVAAANMCANDSAPAGFSIYNVGTGIETSVNQLAEGFKKAWQELCPSGCKKDVSIEHGPGLAGEQSRSVVDSSKLSNELNWKITASVEEGLKLTLESYIVKAGL